MLDLFTLPSTIAYRRLQPASFGVLRKYYQRDVYRAVQYYQTRVWGLINQHLLVRCLTQLPVRFDLETDRFMDVIRSRSDSLAKHFQMTSSLHPGRFFKNSFYGPSSNELVVHIESEIPYTDWPVWYRARPVRLLWYPSSAIHYHLPTGITSYVSVEAPVVLSVDIVQLGWMYRSYLKNRDPLGDELLLSESHFIAQYVLPKILYDQIDHIVLQRFYRLFRGEPMDVDTRRHRFPVTEYTYRLDSELEKILALFVNKKWEYERALQHFPTIVAANSQKLYQLPPTSMTQQILWAYYWSRLDVFEMLIKICGEQSYRLNRQWINHLQRNLRRLQRERVLEIRLNQDLYFEAKRKIDFILSI